MWLVVGLGNPGPTYRHTRHNMGFQVVDRLADRLGLSSWRLRFEADAVETRLADRPVLLLKPRTYMNLSGTSVRPAAEALGIGPDRILVIHDDVDLPPGTLRLKDGGGHGGHNGLRSLIEELGTSAFLRVRVGIGRPDGEEVTQYVLGAPSPGEQETLSALLEHAADAVEAILEQGLVRAANRFNRRPKPAREATDEPPGNDADDQ